MSFRKRNIFIGNTTQPIVSPSTSALPPGVRPSPVNGQYTTSTGTPSLDSLFAGHAGLPLGCSLLVEEPGTTDYGGVLLRYYAAEGIVQGHAVTVIGTGDRWAKDLPAVTKLDVKENYKEKNHSGKMKIAWRYERLGEFGSGIGGFAYNARRQNSASSSTVCVADPRTFCHTFDLTKKLSIPSDARLTFIDPPSTATTQPFKRILSRLDTIISSAPRALPHRIIIPSLLSPALYPLHASSPQHLLWLFYGLRTLLRKFPEQLTIMISIPTGLYPRSTGLMRWAEILSDSVLELVPLPHNVSSTSEIAQEPQGLVHLWKLPVLGEKGGGASTTPGVMGNLAFMITRHRFEIIAYTLPPTSEVEKTDGSDGGVTRVDLEF